MQMSVLETSNAIADVTLTFVAFLLKSTTQVRRTREKRAESNMIDFSFPPREDDFSPKFRRTRDETVGQPISRSICSAVSSRVRWAKDCSKPEPG